MASNTTWKTINTDIFWGEVAPCDHVVQIYENDNVFLHALTGFVGVGINAGDCVIVIATANHLQALYSRLDALAINVPTLIQDDRYIPIDADVLLSKFMVNGWPDEQLFAKTISELLERGTCKGRKIRAFGEMVALLWGRGLNGATVHLEHLWSNFCNTHKLSLFCAYPKIGFTGELNESLTTICNCHSKIIHGTDEQISLVKYSEIQYRESA